MPVPSLTPFSVTVDFLGDRATLGIRGEVDICTAADLGSLIDAVIHRDYRFVVLDLGELAFIDAAGLGVIERAARRLGTASGTLTLRSPSATLRRMLDITDVTRLVVLEQRDPAADHLGPEQDEQTAARSGPANTTAADDLVRQLRLTTALPAANDVVDGALRLVVALARATVGGADGVSVSLRRNGRLATVAASDQTISDMDADQYATGEGPCVDASVEGRWFHVESLDSETRWPAFTPRAQALGINAILSSPLRDQDQTVGALNIYSRTTAAFTPTDQKLASVFATEASTILTDAAHALDDDRLDRRVSDALLARQIIAQAQGVIMQRDSADEDAAYDTLRRDSLRTGLPLRDQAGALLAATRGPQPGVGSVPEGDSHA